MDLYEAIEKRRTIRAYKGAATEEQLRRIVLAGAKAPSARNSQPWEFIIVEDPVLVQQLAELKYQLSLQSQAGPEQREQMEQMAAAQRDSFRNASVLAVCNKVDWERSCWLAIENISLAAVAEGLGTGIVLYWDEARAMAGELLGLPPDMELTAILKVGTPAEEGHARDRNPYASKRPEFSWLHKNRYRGK